VNLNEIKQLKSKALTSENMNFDIKATVFN